MHIARSKFRSEAIPVTGESEQGMEAVFFEVTISTFAVD
jgi:hypothetical protein